MGNDATDGLRILDERRSTKTSTPVGRAKRLPEAVLTVSRDGSIDAVLQLPHQGRDAAGKDIRGAHISILWPANVVKIVHDNVRHALRSRQVRQQEIRSESDSSLFEMICVPQGRDRVLVIVRNLSDLYGIRAGSGDGSDGAASLPARDFLMGELARVTDLQRLKQGRAALICINVLELDGAGHVFGPGQKEEIIGLLAERLKGELRNVNDEHYSDFSEVSIVARFDFRQFAVLLPSVHSGGDAESVAERLVNVLQQPIMISGHETNISARAGIALFPQDGVDSETLFQSAFTAMEYATTSASEPCSFHSGTVSLRNLQRQDLEIGIKAALATEQFALNYQPVIDASSRQAVAVEALLRWPDQMLASRSVRQVISIAERTGLIIPIGEWVLRAACEQVLPLRATSNPDLRLAVNVSAQEFSRTDYVPKLARMLEDLAFDASMLDIEIQEHVLFRDAMKGYAVCAALKELGVRIVIDDFGTGSCSLAHLSRAPIDAIKIDNRFVAGLHVNEFDETACDGAIALAKSLGIQAIAEGVETADQATYLKEAGCDMLQGFFFMKPLDDDELNDFMDLTASRQLAQLWLDD